MSERTAEIESVVRRVLAPLVRADEGKLYLVRADDEAVAVHLGGRFSGCPGNALTTRRIIEPAIRAVAPDADVRVTSGAIVPDGARLIE